MPRIYVLSGPDLGRPFDVESGATFGRTTDCTVTLRDTSVSRMHAHLEHTGSGWRILDTRSRNGLHVRGERVTTADLVDGEEFRLGEVELRIRFDVAVAVVVPVDPAPREPMPREPMPREPMPREPAGTMDATPAPQIQFHTGGGVNADISEEPAEIELEGDWSNAPPPSVVHASAEPARVAPRSPVVAPRSLANDDRARKLAAVGISPMGRTGPVDARGVLQFHRVAQQEGVMRQDLDQQPAWLRYSILAIVAVGTIGLAWLGYQAATAAKVKLAPEEVVEDEG